MGVQCHLQCGQIWALRAAREFNSLPEEEDALP